MDKPDYYQQLLALLKPLRRRLLLRASVERLMRTMWPALVACSFMLLAGRLFPVAGYRIAAGGLLAAWLIGWAIYTAARPVKPFIVARRADNELDLRDRLATALVLSDPRSRVPAGFDRALVSFQVRDALTTAQAIEPRRAFPLRIERALLGRAAAAMAACIVLLVVPNPMDAVVAQRAQVAQTAQAEAAKLEKLAQEIEQDKALAPEDKNELLRRMQEMIAQLKSNPGDAKKALADLAKFQEHVRAKLDPAAPSEAAALDALAAQLAQLAGAKDKPNDSAEAAKLLEQLASELDKLSPEQRTALAGALERAAAQTAASNPNLASALSAMAQTLRSGTSSQQLARAARQAAQAMRDSVSREAFQEALTHALNQADASQRAVAQVAGNGGQASGQAQSLGPGQGQGQGQAQAQGQGQGQGQPGRGGGTTANTLPPAVRSGRAGSPTGPNKAFGSGELETVYAPITAGRGREEIATGQQNQSGETTSREGRSPKPGVSNSALVPYVQVLQRYAEIAGQAMERSYIPAGLKDYVKEYFSGLEP